MTPEQRTAFVDALVKPEWEPTERIRTIEDLDRLTNRGCSISLDSVRDHTNCRCGGRKVYRTGEGIQWCGGSPVVWSTEQ